MTPSFPLSPAVATTSLLFVSVGWHLLGLACQWDHTVFILVCLVPVTERLSLSIQVCPHGSTYQYFVRFWDWVIVRGIYPVRFVYPLMLYRHLGCAHLLALVNRAAINICVNPACVFV